MWCHAIANPDGNSTWQPVTLIPVERYCKQDIFLKLEGHCFVTELFFSSILFWLIVFEVCQRLENNVQMSLAWDQLCLPALAHIFVVTYTKVVFLASLWHFIAYQLKGEYLQGHFPSSWKMEGGQLCAGMVHQGAMFCKPTCVTSCRLQTLWAKLLLSMPSWGIPLPATQHSSSLLVLLVWFLQKCHPHVWQALLVHREPDSSKHGGPATLTLSGSNCSPASGQGRNFCQVNTFICLNGFCPWSSWCCSLSGNNLWTSIWENYLIYVEI